MLMLPTLKQNSCTLFKQKDAKMEQFVPVFILWGKERVTRAYGGVQSLLAYSAFSSATSTAISKFYNFPNFPQFSILVAIRFLYFYTRDGQPAAREPLLALCFVPYGSYNHVEVYVSYVHLSSIRCFRVRESMGMVPM